MVPNGHLTVSASMRINNFGIENHTVVMSDICGLCFWGIPQHSA